MPVTQCTKETRATSSPCHPVIYIAHHAILLGNTKHGSEDDFVRFRDNGKVVFANAPEPKKLVLVDGADHVNIQEIMGVDIYLELIRNWVNIEY